MQVGIYATDCLHIARCTESRTGKVFIWYKAVSILMLPALPNVVIIVHVASISSDLPNAFTAAAGLTGSSLRF